MCRCTIHTCIQCQPAKKARCDACSRSSNASWCAKVYNTQRRNKYSGQTIFNNIWREKLKACLGRHRFCPWLCLARTPSRCMTTSAYLSAHISTFNGVTMANCYDNFNKALWIRRRKHTAVQLQYIPCALGAASFCRSQWLAVRLHFLRNRPARPCNPHTQLRHNINVIS